MKNHYSLMMLFSLIVFSACKKKDAPLLSSDACSPTYAKVYG
jgi:hypothetical protein